jgi:hypothetical protein
MVYTVVLILHIAAGVVGVLLGPPVLYAAATGRVGRLADAYHAAVLLVCAAGAGLALLDLGGLWWFLPVAAGSYAFALAARTVARRRRPGWLPAYIRGQGGAYIALWTAIVVVSLTGMPLLWLLPVALGAPVVEWLALRAHRAGTADPAQSRSVASVG